MRHLLPASPLLAVSLGLLTPSLAAQKVDFVKEIAPILAKRCAECHGAKEPEGDLRLDIKAGVFPEDKDAWTIVPGNAKHEKNEFFYRITLPADDDDVMPAEGKPLTKEQIGVIQRWIDQGAEWPDGGDAAVAALVAELKPKVEKLELPELTAEQKAAEDKVIAAVEKAGGLAMRVAADTHASEVNLSLMGGRADNELVSVAAGLSRSLVRLNLARTKVDDAALEKVGQMQQLRWLSLANTGVSDAALKHLAGLSQLVYLNLYGTQISDAGLAHLSGLKKLRKLYLWQTKATKAGAKKLRDALPDLAVDMGEYAEVLAKIKPPPKDPPAEKKTVVAVNKKCPVSGKDVAADKISIFEGQAIGLCCDKCLKKFEADPAKFIGKVAEFKVATGPVANAKCPVSGKPVDAAQTVGFRGKVIGFCCGNCKAKFTAGPEKFVAKLADVFPADAPAPAGKPAEQPEKKKRPGKKRPGKGKKNKQAGKNPPEGDAAGQAGKNPPAGAAGQEGKGAAAIANSTCPVSGKAIDASQFSVFRRKRIGFCCEDCKAKFDENPRKFLGKLTDVFPNAGKRRKRNDKK